MTVTTENETGRRPRLHWAWVVAAVSFVAILGAAGFRSVPGVMMNPLHYFGARTPVVFGWIFASHQIGAAIAAAGAGRLRDVQGNYDLAFYLAAGLCAVAAMLCLNVRNAQVEVS